MLPVRQQLDFENQRRIKNLGAAQASGEPVTYDQWLAGLEGQAWKDNVRVASVTNVNIASPGAAIDGITMALNDRVLLKDQTTTTERGIYIWNGAGVAMTRAADASTFDEMEGATVPVDEGTNAGTKWKQTAVNGVIGTNPFVFAADGSSAPAASETVSGTVELATQAETNTGTDPLRVPTVATMKGATWMLKKVTATIGDSSATSIDVAHNLGTKDVQIYAYEATGSFREIFVEKQHLNTNTARLLFDSAPATNSVNVVIVG